MRDSPTKPPAFASFSRLVFPLVIFFAMAIAQPAAAQGLTFVARQSSPHPARLVSFAWLSGAISITPLVPPTNHPDIFTGESAFRFSENPPSPNFATLFPHQETETSFVTEVRVPIAQLAASNLRIGFFMQTLHNSNVALGPLAATQALHSLSQPRSVSLYGIGVSIPLGKQSTADISSSLPWNALQRFIRDR
jgi:hypothetical protein